MTVAEFLKSRVEAKGWLSVINIYFDNSLVINPHTKNGYVCLSPGLEMVLSLNPVDTTTTDAIEKTFLVQENKYIDLQQGITAVGFDHMQHFDLNLFSQERMYQDDAPTFLIPNIPAPDTVMGYALDPDTKLAAGTDTATLMDGREVSVLPLYTGDTNSYDKYVGLRIEPYQAWMKNHKKFCTAMNTFLGVGDCI